MWWGPQENISSKTTWAIDLYRALIGHLKGTSRELSSAPKRGVRLLLNEITVGDSYEILKDLPDGSVDSCVTDPPYGLSNEPDINKVLTHWLNDLCGH